MAYSQRWMYRHDSNTFRITNRITNPYYYVDYPISTISTTPEELSKLKVGSQEEKSKTKKMSIVEKFKLAITKEPKKSFRKAEITSEDDLLTMEGQAIFMAWLLEKHAKEFKEEIVDKILKEEKSK